MANYETLKANIAQYIKENHENDITGQLLQQQLLAMVNSLGVGYQYVGIATPATNPGTPDQNVFYLASTAGTYTNFGGIVLADGEIAILKYNGAWSKDSTGAASVEMVNQLGQKFPSVVDGLNDYPFCISDDSGNIIIVFEKNGDFFTKTFNTKKVGKIEDGTLGDFVISDGENVILELLSGNLRTKNFDSKKANESISLLEQMSESLYVTHIVSISDYGNNLRTAMSAISPTKKDRYVIQIPEGVYDATQWFTADELDGTVFCEGVSMKDYVKLQGVGNVEDIVIRLNNSVFNIELSILKMSFWNEIDNITFEASNLRYAIHDDNWVSDNRGKHLKITNCSFSCDNGRPSWGAGHSGKCNAEFYNCKFSTTGVSAEHYGTFQYHDNYYTQEQSNILLYNCRFSVEDTDASCIKFQTHNKATGEYDTYVTMIGNKCNTTIELTTVGGVTSAGTWYVSGFGNVFASQPIIDPNITGDTSKLIDLI